MAIILNKTDGFIKIYEMSAGGQGSIKNPSQGWEYIQGITLTDTASFQKVPRLGSTQQRGVYLGSNINLDVSRFHVGGDELSFANNRNKEYIIKLLFFDMLAGVPEGLAHEIQIAYCKTSDRTIATGKEANIVSRKWHGGEITDSSFSETSTFNWVEDPYVSQTSKVVTHNRGAKPFVWMIDTAGTVIQATVKHTSNNSFTVWWAVASSGTIFYA